MTASSGWLRYVRLFNCSTNNKQSNDVCKFSTKNNQTKPLHFQDFYKKKGRGLVSQSQYIQESFELCAKDFNKRLLDYQSQSHEYHRGCVQGQPLPFIMLGN